MTKKTLHLVKKINVTHFICDNLLGKNHSHKHRMGFGVLVMGVGVYVSKLFGEIELTVIHYVMDGAGYAIHGLGLAPFIEYVMEQIIKEEETLQHIAKEAVVYEDTH